MTDSQLAFHDLFANSDKQPQISSFKAKSLFQQSFNQTLMFRSANPNGLLYSIKVVTAVDKENVGHYDASLVDQELRKIDKSTPFIRFTLTCTAAIRLKFNWKL
jgi:hypothetical protein